MSATMDAPGRKLAFGLVPQGIGISLLRGQPAVCIGGRQTPRTAVARRARFVMGRRSEKIKTRKDAQARARSKVFARVGKTITMAAKAGGPDPTTNKALADALEAAKAVNFPKDTTERAISRATSSEQADYKESSFEAIFIDVLTDNANRAAADIRAIVNKQNMKIASPGSVAFNFSRAGVLRVLKKYAPDADEFLMVAIDAGAEECDVDPNNDDQFRVCTSIEDLAATRKALMDAGYTPDSWGREMIPNTLTEVSEEDASRNETAIELLEELDDVDAVYSNMA